MGIWTVKQQNVQNVDRLDILRWTKNTGGKEQKMIIISAITLRDCWVNCGANLKAQRRVFSDGPDSDKVTNLILVQNSPYRHSSV